MVDGPTGVWLVGESSLELVVNRRSVEARFLTAEPACTAPCAIDLPLGRRTLAFPVFGSRRLELDAVDVGPRPTLYRRALGHRRSRGRRHAPRRIVGVTFGGMSFVTGAALLPIGLATDHDGMTLAGGLTLGVGAVLTAVGIVAIARSPAIEQPGAGTQYDLPLVIRRRPPRKAKKARDVTRASLVTPSGFEGKKPAITAHAPERKRQHYAALSSRLRSIPFVTIRPLSPM